LGSIALMGLKGLIGLMRLMGTRGVVLPRAECAPLMEEVAHQMKLLAQMNLLEAPSPELCITIHLPEPAKMHRMLRFPAPDRGRSRIEQATLRH